MRLSSSFRRRVKRALHLGRRKSERSIRYEIGSHSFKADVTWYRGENCNFHPQRPNLDEPDAIDNYVLKGWAPKSPFIGKDKYITAFGSCFARHVAAYLQKNGYGVFGGDLKRDAYIIRCGEGMVNTAVIAQQFQWAYGEVEFDESLWHDKQGNAAEYLDDVRSSTRKIFDGTDVFIITLGLSEAWYNKITGDVFWRTIPEGVYDPKRHGFKVIDVIENKKNLQAIYRIVRERRPEAAIIFTLSPIPLVATFRPVSCITANSVSKAILRVAVDEFMREHAGDSRLFYFPSYEIVMNFIADPFEDDLRHPRQEVISTVMQTFHRNFLI